MPSVALLLLLALAQPAQPPARQSPASEKPPKPGTAAAFDEDEIAGHPDGEAPPLPKQVNWDLSKSLIASTPRRQRLTLAGPWRFGAGPKRETPTLRKDMGWIEMPAGRPTDAKMFDGKMRSTTKYQGRPLPQQAWAWCERDVAAPLEWVKHQIFLVVRGPWSEAELFVAYQPVKGAERDGGRWFEITESLIYGGEAPVALRLKVPATGGTSPAPYIGLELLPTGPRFDDLRVQQDAQRGELEIAFDLRRPKFILGLPVRLSELPIIAQFFLEDAQTGEELQRFDQSIGAMPQETRSVTVRVAWSAPGAAPPERARLRARLTSAYGGNMDVPYPVEFAPRELPKVIEK
jgi:hypothetical protein